MTDTLYFSADEVMKGIRLLWNEMNFAMFKRELFPEAHSFVSDANHDEYVQGWFKQFGISPFHFWCSIDDDKRKKLNFLIDDCANRELKREKNGGV